MEQYAAKAQDIRYIRARVSRSPLRIFRSSNSTNVRRIALRTTLRNWALNFLMNLQPWIENESAMVQRLTTQDSKLHTSL